MKFFVPKTTKFRLVISNFIKELSFSAALVSLLAFCPAIAHAGFLSFISGLASSQASASVTSSPAATQTSQNIPLPTPAINLNPSPVLADTVAPVSGDSLTAEVGPDGTTADVDQPTNTQISVYVVRDGDSLSKISKLFNVSVNTILYANDLNSHSTISPGDTLIILPMSGIQYTVKKGDTLQGIVKKFGANQDEIFQYNDITLDSSLAVGQTILIPDVESSVAVDISTTNKKPASKPGWGAPGSNPAHDTNGPYYAGYYALPIDHGRETQGLHGYNAVDLAAPTGTPIHASADGVVIISKTGGWNGGYGNYVVISHSNGTQTVYGHTSKNLVSVGQKVVQGQTIALLGATGEATGPHVHFEIRGARNPFASMSAF